MKISEQWLRDYVASARSAQQIAESLTTAGLEVDAIHDDAPQLAGVYVGRVSAVHDHPRSPALAVCTVELGEGKTHAVVCGAPNARTGLHAPIALPGAALANGAAIEASEIHGVTSHGMLCSAAELGLGGHSDRLWALSDAAPVGAALADYLGLPDRILELDLTPNRGDCLSVRGVAREAAIAENAGLPPLAVEPVAPTHAAARAVTIEAPQACAAYAARTVAIEPDRPTPAWLSERLRRAGLRSVSLPVDIGNYIMLDVGQPMHAFDADTLAGDICVRYAIAGETIVTLDDEEVELSPTTLVIADAAGPAAIAGMIGGARTAVGADTRAVVLESACFSPGGVAGQGRRYKIHTDSLHRFERGVDPELHVAAIEYATRLLCEYAQAAPGPVSRAVGYSLFCEDRAIEIEAAQITRALGQAIDPSFVENALDRLGLIVERVAPTHWRATPPSWRFDLRIPADLIEEVARLYGYENLRAEPTGVMLPPVWAPPDAATDFESVLRARGYSEAITYSFVDPRLQRALVGDAEALALDNPIADQMAVMRRTLWAGLIPAWLYNQRRQVADVRLYETGLRFALDAAAAAGITQVPTLAGIVSGAIEPLHWSSASREVDFFDVKGDVEALCPIARGALRFEPAAHPALHPGRCARIRAPQGVIGWIGQLSSEIDLDSKTTNLPYVFELDSKFLTTERPVYHEAISDQPAVSRDLALVVSEQMPAAKLLEAAYSIEARQLRSVDIVDVFTGGDLDSGCKSVALRLIFQDKTSTLSAERVDHVMQQVLSALASRCQARIRGY